MYGDRRPGKSTVTSGTASSSKAGGRLETTPVGTPCAGHSLRPRQVGCKLVVEDAGRNEEQPAGVAGASPAAALSSPRRHPRTPGVSAGRGPSVPTPLPEQWRVEGSRRRSGPGRDDADAALDRAVAAGEPGFITTGLTRGRRPCGGPRRARRPRRSSRCRRRLETSWRLCAGHGGHPPIDGEDKGVTGTGATTPVCWNREKNWAGAEERGPRGAAWARGRARAQGQCRAGHPSRPRLPDVTPPAPHPDLVPLTVICPPIWKHSCWGRNLQTTTRLKLQFESKNQTSLRE